MDKKEIIAGFCRWLEARELGYKTVLSYQDKAKRYLEYLEGHGLDIVVVDHKNIDAYLHYLLVKKRLSRSSRGLFFYALKQFFSFLVERGAIELNPVDRATRIKPEKKIAGCLTNDEIALMINAPGLKTELGMRDTAILALMTAVGPRATAVCGIHTTDIRAEEIRIPPKCSSCGQVDYSGKSGIRAKKKMVAIVTIREKGGGKWSVPLHDKAAFILNMYLANREYARDSNIVFPCYRRREIRPLHRHGLYQLVRKYAVRAGIKGRVSPHSFRHAAITWLLDCGVDPGVVKNLVGHKHLSTTEDYRFVTHRSFNWAGIAGDRSLLEAIDTPVDELVERLRGE